MYIFPVAKHWGGTQREDITDKKPKILYITWSYLNFSVFSVFNNHGCVGDGEYFALSKVGEVMTYYKGAI